MQAIQSYQPRPQSLFNPAKRNARAKAHTSRTRARRRRRAAIAFLAYTAAFALALCLGAGVAAIGIMQRDPTDQRHHYRQALRDGNLCYALYGSLCMPDPYRIR